MLVPCITSGSHDPRIRNHITRHLISGGWLLVCSGGLNIRGELGTFQHNLRAGGCVNPLRLRYRLAIDPGSHNLSWRRCVNFLCLHQWRPFSHHSGLHWLVIVHHLVYAEVIFYYNILRSIWQKAESKGSTYGEEQSEQHESPSPSVMSFALSTLLVGLVEEDVGGGVAAVLTLKAIHQTFFPLLAILVV